MLLGSSALRPYQARSERRQEIAVRCGTVPAIKQPEQIIFQPIYGKRLQECQCDALPTYSMSKQDLSGQMDEQTNRQMNYHSRRTAGKHDALAKTAGRLRHKTINNMERLEGYQQLLSTCKNKKQETVANENQQKIQYTMTQVKDVTTD